MNFLPMHYYTIVVEKQSINQAAAELHITQQTLSAHIAALEAELGCILFQRRPKFSLTYAGEVFYNYARQFEQLYSSMRQEFSDIVKEEQGSLSVGIAHTRGRVLMPELIPIYREIYPNMQIQVVEASNALLIEKLIAGEVEVIIANLIDELPELCSQYFYDEEIILLVPRVLLSEEIIVELQNKADLKLLAKCPFLMNNQDDIAGRIGNIILQKAGFVPHISTTSNNIETLFDLCVKGVGACFCPEILARNVLPSDQLSKLVIVHLNTVYPIRIAWSNKSYVRKAVTAFVDICRKTKFIDT